VKKTTTVLATVALGALLATGSTTASMAYTKVHKRHTVYVRPGNFDFGAGNFDFGNRRRASRDERDFLGDSGYQVKNWWNYNTDNAYCSFDAVHTSYEDFQGPGIRHFCP
jgi:hypothetical protein